MTAHQFTVHGPPVAKERPRAFRKGNYVGIYTPKKTRDYEEHVRLSAPPMQKMTNVSCTLVIFFQDRRRRDIDNVAKSLLDALNGVAWEDDSEVVELHLYRRYDKLSPRVEVVLEGECPILKVP